MTKEEILLKMVEEMPYEIDSSTKPYIMEAMQIYARQESDKKAVAFKDWCDEYISTFISSDELEPKLKKTTEQLLEIFNNSTK